MALQHLLTEALSLLKTQRPAIEHHDQMPIQNAIWALHALESDLQAKDQARKGLTAQAQRRVRCTSQRTIWVYAMHFQTSMEQTSG